MFTHNLQNTQTHTTLYWTIILDTNNWRSDWLTTWQLPTVFYLPYFFFIHLNVNSLLPCSTLVYTGLCHWSTLSTACCLWPRVWSMSACCQWSALILSPVYWPPLVCMVYCLLTTVWPTVSLACYLWHWSTVYCPLFVADHGWSKLSLPTAWSTLYTVYCLLVSPHCLPPAQYRPVLYRPRGEMMNGMGQLNSPWGWEMLSEWCPKSGAIYQQPWANTSCPVGDYSILNALSCQDMVICIIFDMNYLND